MFGYQRPDREFKPVIGMCFTNLLIYEQEILIIAVFLLLTVNVLFTGCELVKEEYVEYMTVFTGESVVLP